MPKRQQDWLDTRVGVLKKETVGSTVLTYKEAFSTEQIQLNWGPKSSLLRGTALHLHLGFEHVGKSVTMKAEKGRILNINKMRSSRRYP